MARSLSVRRGRIRLILLSLAVFFGGMELLYRLFDPFPYISPSDFNRTEHGNLSRYDELLGWKGVPNGEALLVTENRKVRIKNNSQGFRDIEHSSNTSNPAIVFLGDSFAWGFELEQDEMFIERLRKSLLQYEIFNLSHRGYGTDQSLLTFQNWKHAGPICFVVLLFSENDFENNRNSKQYDKFKPVFQLQGNSLILTNVPIPKDDRWKNKIESQMKSESVAQWMKKVALSSHFINDMIFRVQLMAGNERWVYDPDSSPHRKLAEKDYSLTEKILEKLNMEVSGRGGRLVVIAAPSKREFMKKEDVPYQERVRTICDSLEILYHDLAPAFRKSFLRTYYRLGPHWNAHGNEVAATDLTVFLKNTSCR